MEISEKAGDDSEWFDNAVEKAMNFIRTSDDRQDVEFDILTIDWISCRINDDVLKSIIDEAEGRCRKDGSMSYHYIFRNFD